MLSSKGIVTELQREVLRVFATVPDAGNYYLSGGTALADFFFAHRKSFDLDLFTGEEGLTLPFSRILEDVLQRSLSVNTVRRLESFVEFEVGTDEDSTRVQLAYDSPFRFGEPLDSDLGVKVNDYKDLIVDKLLAFFGRVESRDAIDLYFILQSEDIWELIRDAEVKDPGFDLYWLAVAFERARDLPDDISRWPVEMIREVDPKRLKEQFLSLAEELMAKIRASGESG
ncbi:MAG: nucleotidyl transferase AbiEii/AbiGii toxin family protein [Actinomycetota bacterium]